MRSKDPSPGPESADKKASPTASVRDKAERKAFAAGLALLFWAVSLLLPPIANRQLAQDEHTLQNPIIAAVVAVSILIATAWTIRVAIAAAAVLAIACVFQITYYLVTTAPGRDARNEAASWQAVPLASGANGVASNHEDVFGSARLNWSGSSLRLDLRSTTGTTQQGFWLTGGPPNSRFYFQALVTKIDGGPQVTCPLLFGIASNRAYFTFRLETNSNGDTIAAAYQIIPNSPAFTSGFHAIQLGETNALPYVDYWNVLTPWAGDKALLAISADGAYYRFFVDNRQVFARDVSDVPNHRVAVGVTIIANGLRADAVCQTQNVELRYQRSGST